MVVLGVRSGREKLIEPSGRVEVVEVVAAADMALADEDLRHGPSGRLPWPPSPAAHSACPETSISSKAAPFSAKEILRRRAVGARRLRVDRHRRHRLQLDVSEPNMESCRRRCNAIRGQPPSPRARRPARRRPRLRRARSAREAALAVAPVVSTSSTSRTRLPVEPGPRLRRHAERALHVLAPLRLRSGRPARGSA